MEDIVQEALSAAGSRAGLAARRALRTVAAKTNGHIIALLALQAVGRAGTNQAKLTARRTTVAILPIARQTAHHHVSRVTSLHVIRRTELAYPLREVVACLHHGKCTKQLEQTCPAPQVSQLEGHNVHVPPSRKKEA